MSSAESIEAPTSSNTLGPKIQDQDDEAPESNDHYPDYSEELAALDQEMDKMILDELSKELDEKFDREFQEELDRELDRHYEELMDKYFAEACADDHESDLKYDNDEDEEDAWNRVPYEETAGRSTVETIAETIRETINRHAEELARQPKEEY